MSSAFGCSHEKKSIIEKYNIDYNGTIFRCLCRVDEIHRLKQGEAICYYSDSKTVGVVENYTNGVLNGVFQSFHKNGKIMQSGFYKNGVMDSLWLEYDYRGNLRKYTLVRNGLSFYEKIINESGEITYALLPIEVSEKGIEGSDKLINIKLLYSELDTPYIAAFISPTGQKQKFKDTIVTRGFELIYRWDTSEIQNSHLYGYLFEIDSNDTSIGEYPFSYPQDK